MDGRQRRIGRGAGGLAILVSAAVGGCAPTSLYKTLDAPSPPSGYVFLAPYFTQVTNHVAVTLSQAQAQGAKAGGTQTDQKQSFTATVTLTAIPTQRSYAFVRLDDWYNTSANLTASSDGMLSSSDTSSTQQVGAVLAEVAQTVAAGGGFGLVEGEPGGHEGILGVAPQGPTPPPDDPCLARVKALVAGLPWVATDDVTASGIKTIHVAPADAANVSLDLIVTVFADPTSFKEPTGDDGLIGYLPSPGTAELKCNAPGGTRTIAAPVSLTFYLHRIKLDPQRDFFRNPQDTLAFSEGFITGHKYVDQSPAKTITDTVTAPVRALFPSVSVTQSTQVQTGGGKPDQTTTTTSSTTGPPKN